LYRQAVAITETMDLGVRTVAAIRHLGRLLLRKGKLASATDALQRAQILAEQMPLSIEYGATLLALAELVGRDDLTSATTLAERALGAPATIETSIELGACLVSLY